MASDINGTIYLLHFSAKLAHAQHYLGWTEQPPEYRLADHLAVRNRPAKIVSAAKAAGLTIVIARTWPGETRTEERRMKKMAMAPRLCPICRAAKAAAKRVQDAGAPPPWAVGRGYVIKASVERRF